MREISLNVRIPKTILVRTEKLKENPKNVKDHPESQINGLKELIKLEGFISPLLIDKHDVIWAGHGRLIAARELDMKEIPCVRLENLTKKQLKAIMLMDNRINESAWNKENVEIILDEIQDFNFEEFEMNFDEFRIDEPTEEEPTPEPPAEPKAKMGQVYQLGNHIIMCGDATKDLQKLINGITVNLLLIDPPYGIDIVTKGKVGGDHKLGSIGSGKIVKANQYKPIIGDDKEFEPEFLLSLAENQIIFGANHFANRLPNQSHWLVWDKKDNVASDDNNFSDAELAWTSFKRLSTKMYRHLWSGLIRKGNRDEELSKRIHPTQKPVGLLIEIINDYTKENHTVLDCYLGSGSTLIACEQTNRTCYGMELDPAYVDVIIQRWEDYTGKKAKLVTRVKK